MTAEKLLDSIGMIDEEYINAAENYVPAAARRGNFMPVFLSAAACICIIAAAAAVMRGGRSDIPTLPDFTSVCEPVQTTCEPDPSAPAEGTMHCVPDADITENGNGRETAESAASDSEIIFPAFSGEGHTVYTEPIPTETAVLTTAPFYEKYPDEENIIYCENEYGDYIGDESEPARGGKELSHRLTEAMRENAGNDSVYYAIAIEVYGYYDEREEFINSFISDEGYTYSEITEMRNDIWLRMDELKDRSDPYLNPDVTGEEIEECEEDILELEEERNRLYEIGRGILFEAEQYVLRLESDNLRANGVIMRGITARRDRRNYILVVASAEQINSMPFDNSAGYKICLAAKDGSVYDAIDVE